MSRAGACLPCHIRLSYGAVTAASCGDGEAANCQFIGCFIGLTEPRAPLPACSCGGVVVTSADGKIVCSNTLDDRLRITYSQNLPQIRTLLFGAPQLAY